MKFWKKKQFRRRIDRLCKGSVSVLLCLLMTPFLTIACGLVELYRYQSAAEILQEVVDISSLSTLSSYDKYIHDRFGLMVMAQDAEPESTFNKYLETNKSLVGSNVEIGTATVKPGKNLKYTSAANGQYITLLNQVTDFSETTAMTEFLYEGLNIQDLINKLNQLKGLAALASGASQMADLTAAIKNLVQAGEDLLNCLRSAQEALRNAKAQGEATAKRILEFYEKLSKASFSLDPQNEEASLNTLARDYLTDLLDIYDQIEATVDFVNEFSGHISNVQGYITKMEKELENAKKALKELEGTVSSLTSSEDEGNKNVGQATEKSPSIFQEVMDSLEKALEDAKNQLQADVTDAMKQTANEFVDDIKAIFPVLSIDASYFEVPLSDQAKADLRKIVEALPKTWNEDEKDLLLQAIKDTYLPSLVDLNDLPSMADIVNTLTDAVGKAQSSLENRIKGSIMKILSALVNTIRELFNMDGIYSPTLDAYLSDDALKTIVVESDNPYQALLDAIESLFDAVEDVEDILNGDKPWWELLDAVEDVFDAVESTVNAITDAVDRIVDKIESVAGYLNGSNQASFYDLILLSAYLAYTFPNRTDAGKVTYTEDGNSVALSGSSLTGYSYGDIVTAKSENSGIPGVNGLESILNFLSNAKEGGNDEMFVGAELEYIIAGTGAEVVNQVITFMDIFVIRLLLDIGVVFTDPNVATMAGAATVFSWVVYLLVLVGEPLVDSILIANGGEVPLLKSGCFLTPVGVTKLINCLPKGIKGAIEECVGDIKALGGDGTDFSTDGFGISYAEYCFLILVVTLTEESMLIRLANLIQLESAAYYKSQDADFTFDINKTYTTIQVTVPIEFNSMLSVIDINGVLTPDVVRERGY